MAERSFLTSVQLKKKKKSKKILITMPLHHWLLTTQSVATTGRVLYAYIWTMSVYVYFASV